MSARPADAADRRQGSRLMRQRVRSAWLFLAPMLLVLAAAAGW
ncbi:sugar ABC transporter permease, partial [Mesorhizobium sp. M00.F.Ca.ET.158.01.1.1]